MGTSLLSRCYRINAARDSTNSPSSSPSSSLTYAASAVLPFPLSSLTVSSSFVSSSPSVSASLTSFPPVSVSVHGDSTFVASFSVFSPRARFPSVSASSFSQSSTPSTFPFLSRSSSSLSSLRPSLFFVSFDFFPPSSRFSSLPPLSFPSPSSSCAGARFSAAERERSSSHTADPAAAGAAETLPHEQEEAGGAGEEALSSPFIPAEKKRPVTSPEQHHHSPTAILSAAVRRKAASTGKGMIVERARKVRLATSATREKAGAAAVTRTLLTDSSDAPTSIALSSEVAAAPPARAGTQPTFPDAATAAPDGGAAAAAARAGVASDSKAVATAAEPGPNAPAYFSGFPAAVGARTLTSAAAVPHKARAAATQEEEPSGARGAAAPCGDELLSTAGVRLESTGRAAGRMAAATGGRRRAATGATAAAAHTSVSAAPPAATNSCVIHSCCSCTLVAFGSSATILHESEATTAERRSCSCGSSSSNTMSFDTSGSSRGWRGSSRWSPGSSNSDRSGWSSSSSWVSSCSNWTASASYHSSITPTRSRSSNSVFSWRNSSVGGGSPGAANHTSNTSVTRLRRKGRRHHPHFFFSSSASSVFFPSRLLSTRKIAAWGSPAIAAAATLQPQQQYKQGLSVSSSSPSSLPPVRSSLLLAPSSCYFSSVPHSQGSEGAPENAQEVTQEQVEIAQFHDGSRGRFRPHPFNRRFSRVKTPVFPIEPRNLRLMYKRKSKRRRGRGDKSNAKGFRLKHVHLQAGRYRGPRSRTFEGGKTPLYRRIPKWPDAWLARQRKTMEPLNLSKLRAFIEGGRLDARFPITQRHLHDSRCVKVRNGVRLFNVNDYPFPYKIQVEVSGADQSSIDAIRRVGGEVHIVYRNRLNLRAHVKPYKFEVLPKTARPSLEMLHYLEKMRARGCVVKYIKPQWLIDEEKSLKRELLEFEAEALIAAGEGVDRRDPKLRASVEEAQEKLLRQFRLRETLAAKLEREQQQQQQQHTFAAPQDDDKEKNTQS